MTRFRLVSLVLIPAIIVAAAILGYYTWRTAAQFTQLGEQAIVHSTLLLVREKVDRVEQTIIGADNAVFELVDLTEDDSLAARWLPRAAKLTPTVSSVLVLDDSGNIVEEAFRTTKDKQRSFVKMLLERILPDLELEKQRIERLRHLHRSYGGESYLLAYKAVRHAGRRYYLVVQHDPEYVVKEEFPSLFATEEGKRLYNVVDENNRRVFGPSLAGAGDYLVGRRFPTTLYNWRLQVAPKQAPLLEAQGRSRRFNEAGLIGTSLLVLVLGAAYLLYAANKERRLNVLKSEFIANVSHELKTPLSIIRMFGEMLLSKRVRNDEKKQQYLEIICRESERLSALIENVLDFAALERGKQIYDIREADPAEVIHRAIDTFRYRIEQDGIPVKFVRPEEGDKVLLDDQAVLLAVVNLLDNAAKYGRGTPIEVKLERREHEIEIAVRDHGPGIATEELKRVFERFYRAPGHRDTRGSGIGLSLVKHIAEVHGGRAWARNAEDGGAVVGFTIDLKMQRKAIARLDPSLTKNVMENA